MCSTMGRDPISKKTYKFIKKWSEYLMFEYVPCQNFWYINVLSKDFHL